MKLFTSGSVLTIAARVVRTLEARVSIEVFFFCAAAFFSSEPAASEKSVVEVNCLLFLSINLL